MNPYIKLLHNPPADMFFGRQYEIQTIVQGLSAPQPVSYIIDGAPKIGKSTLIRYLCDKGPLLLRKQQQGSFALEPENFLFIYIDFQALLVDQAQCETHICDAILTSDLTKNIFEKANYSSDKVQDEFDNRLDRLAALMWKMRKRIVLCIDNQGGGKKDLSASFVHKLSKSLPFHSFLCASTTYWFETSSSEHQLPPGQVGRLRLGLLKKEEARDMVLSPSVKVGSPLSDQETDLILSLAGRHPYSLSLVANEFSELRTEAGLDQMDDILDKNRNQIVMRIENQPAIRQFHTFIWSHLDQSEQEMVYSLARQDTNPVLYQEGREILNRLIAKSVVYNNLTDGRFYLFSELFKSYLKGKNEPPILTTIKSLKLDTATELLFNHAKQELTPKDCRVFEFLTTNRDELCRLDELKSRFWGESSKEVQQRSLNASIHRIRKMLDNYSAKAYVFQNKHGVGYKFNDFIRELNVEKIRFSRETISNCFSRYADHPDIFIRLKLFHGYFFMRNLLLILNELRDPEILNDTTFHSELMNNIRDYIQHINGKKRSEDYSNLIRTAYLTDIQKPLPEDSPSIKDENSDKFYQLIKNMGEFPGWIELADRQNDLHAPIVNNTIYYEAFVHFRLQNKYQQKANNGSTSILETTKKLLCDLVGAYREKDPEKMVGIEIELMKTREKIYKLKNIPETLQEWSYGHFY